MAQGRHTLMDPPIEELLDKVDSKFTLVALGSARARQVNSVLQQPRRGSGQGGPAPGGVGFGQARLHRFRGDRGRQGHLHPAGPRRGGRPGRSRSRTRPRPACWATASPGTPRWSARARIARSDRDTRRRGRRPGCELGARRRGAADSADGRRPRNGGLADDRRPRRIRAAASSSASAAASPPTRRSRSAVNSSTPAST